MDFNQPITDLNTMSPDKTEQKHRLLVNTGNLMNRAFMSTSTMDSRYFFLQISFTHPRMAGFF